MADRKDISNEDPCLHFEAKLVPDLSTKIKKRLIAAICDLKQPCRKRLSSPRCRSELIDSTWVVIVPGQNKLLFLIGLHVLQLVVALQRFPILEIQ